MNFITGAQVRIFSGETETLVGEMISRIAEWRQSPVILPGSQIEISRSFYF
jgi:hypothetical protein